MGRRWFVIGLGAAVASAGPLRLGIKPSEGAGSREETPAGRKLHVRNAWRLPFFGVPDYAGTLAWGPEGRLAVGGGLNKHMSVWDARRGRRLPGPGEQLGGVQSLAFSSDGRYLAVGRGWVGQGLERYSVSLWDARSGARVQNLVDEAGEIRIFGARWIGFSPDSRYLAVAYGVQLAFYESDGSAWRRVGSFGPSIGRGAFRADGAHLAGLWSTSILLLEVPTARVLADWGRIRARTESGVAIGAAPALDYRPDGKAVAAGSAAYLGIYDPGTGAVLREVALAEPYHVRSLAYSPDSRHLAAGVLRAIHLLDADTGTVDLVLDDAAPSGVSAIAFSPDGALLAAVGGPEATVFEFSR